MYKEEKFGEDIIEDIRERIRVEKLDKNKLNINEEFDKARKERKITPRAQDDSESRNHSRDDN